jgi:hypothetical protein
MTMQTEGRDRGGRWGRQRDREADFMEHEYRSNSIATLAMARDMKGRARGEREERRSLL